MNNTTYRTRRPFEIRESIYLPSTQMFINNTTRSLGSLATRLDSYFVYTQVSLLHKIRIETPAETCRHVH